MHKARLLLPIVLLVASLLSGCSSSGNSGGGAFDIAAPATAGGAYTFTAKVTADNYTWDLGDHLTTKYGSSITHTYDFKDGTITVLLHARTGKDTKDYHQSLVLGSGLNQKPTFRFEVERNWTITGEPIRFSASLSTDPESDTLRTSWSCNRFADAVRIGAHTHAVYGNSFATAPAGSVTAGITHRVMPTADKTYTGDFCDALGAGTPLSTHTTTIAGSFTKTGIYDIYLIAADGAHPTTSGSFRLYVTTAGERPDPIFRLSTGDQVFNGGANGGLQTLCSGSQVQNTPCDAYSQQFTLPLGGLNGTYTLTYDPGPAGAVPQVNWNLINVELKHGNNPVVSSDGPGSVAFDGANLALTQSPYVLTVTLKQGAQVNWSLDLGIRLDMDPAKVYQ